MNARPSAPSCEHNRDPILQVLREYLAQSQQVLEVASGTGQHAVHFAAAMPWLQWQCSDRAEHLPGIQSWLDHAALPNTPAPIELDVATDQWPVQDFDAVFTANSLHIMGWAEVQAFFAGVGRVMQSPHSTLVVYGPFNRGGQFTSDSNRQFDASLRARDPRMGIRDIEAVQALATDVGMSMIDDVEMPANNRCLVWRRQ